MADLFSNVPIPQPIDPLQKQSATQSPLIAELMNDRQRKYDMFKIAEQSRLEDLNTMSGYDAYKLGGAFGGLFNKQVERARELIGSGMLSPMQSRQITLSLINDYNKYYNIHAKPFNDTFDIHANLSTNPQALDQYNESIPIGQQYIPMSIEELAITKDNMMNRIFDPESAVFDEDGNVTVVDELTDQRVKPEMVSTGKRPDGNSVGLGGYDHLFASQIQNQDVGSLYDWGQQKSTKEVVSRQGKWNERAANDYFDLNIGLNNREGRLHRAQLLDTYENELGDAYMTPQQRKAFIDMDDSVGSVWGKGGLAENLMGDKGKSLWKKATYFEPTEDSRAIEAREDYKLKMDIINGGREDRMPIYSVSSTARYIRKVGDDDTISIQKNGSLIEVIPEMHYIDSNGRHVLRAKTKGMNISDQVAAMAGEGGLPSYQTIDIDLTGANYDAVDRYVRAKHGGVRLEDLKAGALSEYSQDEFELNKILNLSGTGSELTRFVDDDSGDGQAGSAPYKLSYQKKQERFDSAMGSVRQMFSEYPEYRNMFAAQESLFAGVSKPNEAPDVHLEYLVRDLVDAGYTDAQISTALSTQDFYNKLDEIGYAPVGRGLTDYLRRMLSSILEFFTPDSAWESALTKQRRGALDAAKSTIESVANPNLAPNYNE